MKILIIGNIEKENSSQKKKSIGLQLKVEHCTQMVENHAWILHY